jgi:aryl-alcohol dehydrogenase-like predicted oxidoreductase
MEEMKPATDKMVYRYLGNTGLKVSVLGLGNWLNNKDDSQNVECTKACSRKWYKLFSYGGNLWFWCSRIDIR